MDRVDQVDQVGHLGDSFQNYKVDIDLEVVLRYLSLVCHIQGMKRLEDILHCLLGNPTIET